MPESHLGPSERDPRADRTPVPPNQPVYVSRTPVLRDFRGKSLVALIATSVDG